LYIPRDAETSDESNPTDSASSVEGRR